jgi:cytochrome c nitrite reductase small subunit
MKASHRRAAVCNDCHAPHDFVGKYSTKAINGFFHSWAFTTGWFPENIRINARNRRITEEACLHCHADITSSIRAIQGHQASESCLACHREVGHH